MANGTRFTADNNINKKGFYTKVQGVREPCISLKINPIVNYLTIVNIKVLVNSLTKTFKEV